MSIGDVSSNERGSGANALTPSEAAWLAGFLDGEGSFSIRPQSSRRDKRIRSTVCTVCVSQAEPRTEVLFWLKEKFGGCVASHGTERRSSNFNKSLRWGVTGAMALRVCEEVLPYLRLKARQAQLIIDHQATKANTANGVRAGTRRSDWRVPPEVMRTREQHVEEMALLNRRGTKPVERACQLAM